MSQGLLAAVIDITERIRASADILVERLTALRAAALDNLDASVLDSAGPLQMPPATIAQDIGAMAGAASRIQAANFVAMAVWNTAGAWQTALSVSGAGVLKYMALLAPSAQVQGGLRVTIDGVVVNEVGPVTIATAEARVLVGLYVGGSFPAVGFDRFPFRTSLLIEVNTDATSLELHYAYHTTGSLV